MPLYHTWRTTVKPTILLRRLGFGTLSAAAGILLLIGADLYFTPLEMGNRGLIIFFIAIALVAIGLTPYRRLQRQKLQPDTLRLDCKGFLHYQKGGELKWSLSLANLHKIHFRSNFFQYGIELEGYSLPFFSERSYEELKGFLPLAPELKRQRSLK